MTSEWGYSWFGSQNNYLCLVIIIQPTSPGLSGCHLCIDSYSSSNKRLRFLIAIALTF